jgi:hypothetical protein
MMMGNEALSFALLAAFFKQKIDNQRVEMHGCSISGLPSK